MKWIKRGIIFNPKDHQLPNGCVEFAQSPQTVVFNDRIRIYFSTREKDHRSGLYLSHIAFVDFDLDLKNILGVSKRNVIPLGEIGAFDEHGIFPINPLKHNNKITAYTSGWSRRKSVPVETGIGLVTSDDNGDTFKRTFNGPILSSSLKEPMLVGDPFVKVFDNVYYMWYIFGIRWLPESQTESVARIYKIGQATSLDGVNWRKNDGKQIIPNVLNDHECQALPTVIKLNNKYHMYFCFREATDFRANAKRSYKLGYAYSSDLHTWTRKDEDSGIGCSPGEWDSDMMCYPHIFECNNKVFLLYNGNAFGKEGFGLAELNNS
ncbi:MAG: hypothetical protein AB7O73_03735 [Bacteroidia bacterium]